jgi:hypothetical protein
MPFKENCNSTFKLAFTLQSLFFAHLDQTVLVASVLGLELVDALEHVKLILLQRWNEIRLEKVESVEFVDRGNGFEPMASRN